MDTQIDPKATISARHARGEFWKLAKYIEDNVPAGAARSEANWHLSAALDSVYDAIYGQS